MLELHGVAIKLTCAELCDSHVRHFLKHLDGSSTSLPEAALSPSNEGLRIKHPNWASCPGSSVALSLGTRRLYTPDSVCVRSVTSSQDNCSLEVSFFHYPAPQPLLPPTPQQAPFISHGPGDVEGCRVNKWPPVFPDRPCALCSLCPYNHSRLCSTLHDAWQPQGLHGYSLVICQNIWACSDMSSPFPLSLAAEVSLIKPREALWCM